MGKELNCPEVGRLLKLHPSPLNQRPGQGDGNYGTAQHNRGGAGRNIGRSSSLTPATG
jgi:hypothetical protein